MKDFLTVLEKDPEKEEGKNILERVNTILNKKDGNKKGRKPRNKKKVRFTTDIFNTKSDIFEGKLTVTSIFSVTQVVIHFYSGHMWPKRHENFPFTPYIVNSKDRFHPQNWGRLVSKTQHEIEGKFGPPKLGL